MVAPEPAAERGKQASGGQSGVAADSTDSAAAQDGRYAGVSGQVSDSSEPDGAGARHPSETSRLHQESRQARSHTESERSAASTRRRRFAVPFAVAALVLALDQFVKYLVIEHLRLGEHHRVIGEALQWVYVRNPGAAFSLGVNVTWAFTALSTAVVVFVVVFLIVKRRVLRSAVWAVFFGLLLGGSLGNLTDRLLRGPGFARGHVIDFIYTPWMMPAIYNLADVAISVGMAIFVLLTLTGVRLDGSRPARQKRQRDAI